MKRSEVNHLLRETLAFFNKHSFHLPLWAKWSPEQWRDNIETAKRIKSLQMGWDITDFGSNDFYKTGLILFCIRNGSIKDKKTKPYAEKIMVVRENQETPWHYHRFKEEDIINRGGGKLILHLAHPNKDDQLDMEREVNCYIDEVQHNVSPNEAICLEPGQSITLSQCVYHRFYAKAGGGTVLTGEVSRVNDDLKDNYFLNTMGRFSDIEEDEDSLYPLWSELPE